jgi:tripartite-type tricarboxylate transporter receptor subunit TctC
VQEFINLAKAKPGQVIYASSGAGTISHLAMELFRTQAKIDTLLHVPYKGGAPSVAAVAGGEVQATFDQLIAIMPQARAGRIRALAVSSGKRVEIAPELPTLAESGLPAFEVIVWSAIFAPAGTPRGIVNRLNAEINRILQQPEMRERFLSINMVPVGGPPDEAADFVKREIARWAKVINEAGVKPID